MIGLLEGIEGDKGDESDWRADDAYEYQVRRAQTEQRDKLFHVLRRGQEVWVGRTDQLKSRDRDHVPAAVAPQIIDRGIDEQVKCHISQTADFDESKEGASQLDLLVFPWKCRLDKRSRLLSFRLSSLVRRLFDQ